MRVGDDYEGQRLSSVTPDSRIVSVYVTDIDGRHLIQRVKPDPQRSQVYLAITEEPPQFRLYKLKFELVGKVTKNQRGMRVDAVFFVKESDEWKVPDMDNKTLNYLGGVLTDAVKNQHDFNRVAPITGDLIMME